MPEEKLDLLLPRSPFLQMFIHHVLEGDCSLCADKKVEQKENRLNNLDFSQHVKWKFYDSLLQYQEFSSKR